MKSIFLDPLGPLPPLALIQSLSFGPFWALLVPLALNYFVFWVPLGPLGPMAGPFGPFWDP